VTRAGSLVLILGLVAPVALAAGLPPAFRMPSGFTDVPPSNLKYVAFDGVAIDDRGTDGRFHAVPREGHVWTFDVRKPDTRADQAMPLIAASLAGDGWTVVRSEGELVAKKSAGGSTFWYRSYPNSERVVVLEECPPPRKLELAPPAATVEAPSDRDFTFALPFPGGTFVRTAHDPGMIEIKPKGAAQPLFLHPDATKWYALPPDVSSYEFVKVKSAALQLAGWSIEREAIGSDGVVIAHFTKTGRDIWLYDRAAGQESITVADLGAATTAGRLKHDLATEGHVALYGIYFDTDSATPKPESETTLRNILQLLQSDPSLQLEIEGHTDDTGAAAHNEQLSAGRAGSVQAWLTAHGIAAGRLTVHGYGATKPVADNHTPEGRARNRRVELRRRS